MGSLLAQALHLPFHDTDDIIEKRMGLTINKIFAVHGEKTFRQWERDIVIDQLCQDPRVLALGGGAFMDHHIRRAIRKKALSIWLNVPLEVLYRRVGHRNTRPLLADGDQKSTLARLFAERQSTYALADITVIGNDNRREVLKKILAAIARHGIPHPPRSSSNRS